MPASSIDRVMSLLYYKPIDFVMPTSLRVSLSVNVFAVAVVLLALGASGAYLLTPRFARPSSRQNPD